MKDPKFIDGSWVCESERKKVFAWLPKYILYSDSYSWLKWVWKYERPRIDNGWKVGETDCYYDII